MKTITALWLIILAGYIWGGAVLWVWLVTNKPEIMIWVNEIYLGLHIAGVFMLRWIIKSLVIYMQHH